MALTKNKAGKGGKPTAAVSSEEKIARLLGLLAVRDMEQKTDQVVLLRSAGFEVSEVASMLGMTENHVKVATHHGRKKRASKKPVH